MSDALPELPAGRWVLDPVHSEIAFTVRHLMVSKVRGQFTGFEGELRVGASPLESSVEVSIDLNTITTRNEQRDAHIRSADFFDVEKFPTMTYRSERVERDGDGFTLPGELTLRNITKRIDLRFEFNGVIDGLGSTRAGFTAAGQLDRRDFGVDINMPLDGGGVVVSDHIQILIEIEAVYEG